MSYMTTAPMGNGMHTSHAPLQQLPQLQQLPHATQQLPHATVTVDSTTCRLEVRQQPLHGRVAIGKEKDRKPLDPPPFIQLSVDHTADPSAYYLQSPYYFMMACLESADGKEQPNGNLLGTLVSSLHKLKDTDNKDGGFFVFGDLSVKQEGKYRLRFYLHVMRGMESTLITSIQTDEFTVYPAKTFPGMAESTFLTRSFSDQGVRLRLRKDSRTMTTRKRNSAAASMVDQHRNTRQRVDMEGEYRARGHSLNTMPDRSHQMNGYYGGPLQQSPGASSLQQSPILYQQPGNYTTMPPHSQSPTTPASMPPGPMQHASSMAPMLGGIPQTSSMNPISGVPGIQGGYQQSNGGVYHDLGGYLPQPH